MSLSWAMRKSGVDTIVPLWKIVKLRGLQQTGLSPHLPRSVTGLLAGCSPHCCSPGPAGRAATLPAWGSWESAPSPLAPWGWTATAFLLVKQVLTESLLLKGFLVTFLWFKMRRTFLPYVPTWQALKVRRFVMVRVDVERLTPAWGRDLVWDISCLLLLVWEWEGRGISEEFVAMLLVWCLCILAVTEGHR